MTKKVLLAMAVFAAASGVFADSLTGKQIMKMSYDREKPVTSSFNMRMTLINSSGKKRVREIAAYTKDYGENKKTVMVFLVPADVKGVGYLSYTYKESEKDDDRWLYMPSLKKARRIAGSSSQGYFMGTDFTYDDMSGHKPDNFAHTLLGEENINGKNCWKIESVPIKKSNYSKYISWIEQESLMQIKAEFYDLQKNLLKVLTASSPEKKDGMWITRNIEMNNVQKKHTTVIESVDIEFNKELSDSYFRVSSLEAGKIK